MHISFDIPSFTVESLYAIVNHLPIARKVEHCRHTYLATSVQYSLKQFL